MFIPPVSLLRHPFFRLGFLVILSAAVSGNEMAQWFSPVSWTTLNKLDVGKLTQYPTFTYVMVVYMNF